MRFQKIILAFALFLVLSGEIFAHDRCNQSKFVPCEKTYIKANQIGFVENEILIDMGNAVLCTSAVYSDEVGYYFRDYDERKCEKTQWKCEICGNCNDSWYTLCLRCSHLRS